MESQEMSAEIFEKFTWKIENFSSLNLVKIYSEPFILCGYPWRILLFPKGNKSGNGNNLSIYLEPTQTANMSEGWSRDVKFKLLVFNQHNTKGTITEECDHKFKANEDGWGFDCFMTLSKFHDPKYGFLVKDACIVGAEVFVSKSTHEKPVNQATKQVINTALTVGCQTSHMHVEGLVCHAELVSAVLGKVLYFLKTKKVKDMNEQACKDLQALWEELKKFKFDVTWLEPLVQSSLAMGSYVEKALEAEKLKEYMVVLELEIKRVKTKLDVVEANRDAERDLLKKKDFKEISLDSELGCGTWRP